MQHDQIKPEHWEDVPKPKYIARIARAEREEENGIEDGEPIQHRP